MNEERMSDSKKQRAGGSCNLDQETAEQLMECVLMHYVKHHYVVLEKLRLAQCATMHALKEVSEFCDEIQKKKNTGIAKSLEKSQSIWDENIQLFINSGISEIGLSKIDKVFTTIPTPIKKHYDSLMAAETDLLEAISELQDLAKEYKAAYARVRMIQSGPDKMSGLAPSCYDEELKFDRKKAYKIIVTSETSNSVH